MADRAAVVGDPIEHSLSPAIFASFSKRLGRPVEYSAVRVPEGALAGALERLEGEGCAGVNVTRPHKRAALALCASADEAASACGAANCLSFSGGALKGHNTDVDGFLDALALLGYSARARDAVIFGAGGAARAAAWALLKTGAARVTVWARRRDPAAQLARDLGCEAGPPRRAALWVNATPLGWKDADPAPFEAEAMCEFALDMTYGRDTAFLREARKAGAKADDGRTMLVAQAARSWELWFGPLGDERRRELTTATTGEVRWR